MFTESLGQHHSHAGIQTGTLTTHLCLTYEILQHRRLIVLVRNVAKLHVFRFNFMDACPDLSRCVCCSVSANHYSTVGNVRRFTFFSDQEKNKTH